MYYTKDDKCYEVDKEQGMWLVAVPNAPLRVSPTEKVRLSKNLKEVKEWAKQTPGAQHSRARRVPAVLKEQQGGRLLNLATSTDASNGY